MENHSIFNECTNLYSLSKTLRFELVPVGETLNYIKEKGLLLQDKQRSKDYEVAKKIIDEYHKWFIEEALGKVQLSNLKSYYAQYDIPQKEDKQKKEFEKIQENLRKEIVINFTKHPAWNNLIKNEFIKEDLLSFIDNEVKKDIIKKFKKFTTYFTGFNKNRKNMYSDENKAGSIAFRLINQNLPKFIDNIKIFLKIKENKILENDFTTILTEIKPTLKKLHFINNLDEIFTIEFYNNILTQQSIDDFNTIIGGYSSEDKKEKIRGLNEYINLYNQQQTDKKNRLPKCKVLFKQILSEKNTVSFLPEKFTNDAELLESIEKYYQELNQYVLTKSETNKISLIDLLKNLHDYDLDNIYIKNDIGLTNIAQQMFGDWSVFEECIKKRFEFENPKKNTKKWEEDKEKSFKNPNSFSIKYLQDCLEYVTTEKQKNIAFYFAQFGLINNDTENKKDIIETLNINYNNVKDILNGYDKERDLMKDNEAVQKIKIFLDSIKNVQRFIKPLLGDGKETEKDNLYYAEFDRVWEILKGVNKLYDKIRNYITKKPYSTEKIKLNFEKSNLLNDWDVQYNTKSGQLFINDGLYYLGIINKKLNDNEIKNIELNPSKNSTRILIDSQKPDNKNTPRLFIRSKGSNYAPAVSAYKLPIHEIIDLYDKGKFKINFKEKNEIEYKDSLIKLINYFKNGFLQHEFYKHYMFKWKESEKYNSINEFYQDVISSCYQIKKININWNSIVKLVEEGKLYLFQIYNKDFSKHSKGKPNLHTMYWKMLFDETNLQNVVYKLNGQAEIFYREQSIKKENIVIHNANECLDNKNNLNHKKTSIFDYDLIKDKRFTSNKFHFHVPITMNFKANGNVNMNEKVLDIIKNNGIEHIIGIDRGERHLIYLTLIDLHGKIIKQFSLNEITNQYKENQYKTNYHQLLDKKESDKKNAQLSWGTIENIKELKEGYISQIIHQITSLMILYKAIVVLEDLNMGFMRGRQKVDKQIYQKFEKMLIDKLNYYVDKEKSTTETGGLLKALQLSSKSESFEKLGNQSGFIFYVPAWNTSKIDPTTGFVNYLHTKYESIKQAKEFFEKFETIQFNSIENYFEFKITNYMAFNQKSATTQQNWTICTNGNRLENYRNKDKNNQWDTRKVNLTNDIKSLFGKKNIDYTKGSCIKNEIVQNEDAKFFKDLFYFLKLTLQIRNSKTGTEEDYLLSCVKNNNGNFYDSRVIGADKKLPENADANGAYNIARKGLMLIQRVQGKLQKLDDNGIVHEKNKLVISNNEWLNFAQKNN